MDNTSEVQQQLPQPSMPANSNSCKPEENHVQLPQPTRPIHSYDNDPDVPTTTKRGRRGQVIEDVSQKMERFKVRLFHLYGPPKK
jgi:hypothetical protein